MSGFGRQDRKFTLDDIETYIPEEENKVEILDGAIDLMETQLSWNRSRLELPLRQRPGPIECEVIRDENVKLDGLIRRCKLAKDVLEAQARPENTLSDVLSNDERMKKKLEKKVYTGGKVNKAALEELKAIDKRIRLTQLQQRENIKNQKLGQFRRFEAEIDAEIKEALKSYDYDLAIALADSQNLVHDTNEDLEMEGYTVDENNNIVRVFRCKYCNYFHQQKRNLTRHLVNVHEKEETKTPNKKSK